MLNDTTANTPPARTARPAATGPAKGDDEPLDPAVERVRIKLARLMALGIGTLLIGVVAVFGAVIYRSAGEGSTPAGGEARFELVPGATLEGASLGDGGLLMRIAMPDGTTQLVVLDAATGAARLRVTLGTR